MGWVLIIAIYAGGVATAEYDSRDACMTAGYAAQAAYEASGSILPTPYLVQL